MKGYILLISFLCIYQVIECKESPKVKVDVYYETLCPDSIQFIRRQLYPTFNKIGEIMDITLIPFGKAEVSLKRFFKLDSFRKVGIILGNIINL